MPHPTSPITLTVGTLDTQLALIDTALIQRLTMAIVITSEYVLLVESSGDTNYTDRAIFARLVAGNIYWGQAFACLLVSDPSFSGSTDQDIMDRVWKDWHVGSYLFATVPNHLPLDLQ